MDSKLYKAATSGEVAPLEQVASTNPQLLLSKAPQENTALHMAAKLGHARFVTKICDLCTELLEMRNSQGDTPLHCAARAGRLEVVQILVEHYRAKPSPSKPKLPKIQQRIGKKPFEEKKKEVEYYYYGVSSPWSQNAEVGEGNFGEETDKRPRAKPYAEVGEGNFGEETDKRPRAKPYAEVGEGNFGKETDKRPRAKPGQRPRREEIFFAGYLGIQNIQWDTALHEALRHRHMDVAIKLLDSDRELARMTNFANESPLHLAVKGELQKVVESILIVSPPDNRGEAGEIFAAISKKQRQLVALKDYTGRTALHYAMWRNNDEAVDMILGIDSQVVPYSADKKGFSPLHIAAAFGSEKAMAKLINRCPDTIEQLDPKGRNLFHIAILNHKLLSSKRIGIPNAGEKLNEQDEDGNTPLHLAAKYWDPRSFYRLAREDEKVDLALMNNLGQTALYLSDFGILLPKFLACPSSTAPWRRRLEMPSVIPEERLKKYDGGEEMREKHKKRENTYMVVATLIATVTFATGIAVPGGFKGSGEPKPGTATLADRLAFQVFIIFDTIAMWLSIAGIFCYLFQWKTEFGIRGSLPWSNSLTKMACFFMLLAFGTGVYVIISPRCIWLAVLICVISSVLPCLYVAWTLFRNCWLAVHRPKLDAAINIASIV